MGVNMQDAIIHSGTALKAYLTLGVLLLHRLYFVAVVLLKN